MTPYNECPVCGWSGKVAERTDRSHRYYTHTVVVDGEMLQGKTCSMRTKPKKDSDRSEIFESAVEAFPTEEAVVIEALLLAFAAVTFVYDSPPFFFYALAATSGTAILATWIRTWDVNRGS